MHPVIKKEKWKRKKKREAWIEDGIWGLELGTWTGFITCAWLPLIITKRWLIFFIFHEYLDYVKVLNTNNKWVESLINVLIVKGRLLDH